MFNMFHNKLRKHTHTKCRQSRMEKSAESSSGEPSSTFRLIDKIWDLSSSHKNSSGP